MMRRIYQGAIAVLFLVGIVMPALATVTTYQYKDNNGSLFNVQIFSCGSSSCTAMILEDSSGNEKFTAGNPGNVAAAATAFADGWNVTEGTKADAAWASGSGSVIAILKAIATAVNAQIPAGTNTIGSIAPLTATSTQTKVTITTAGTFQQYLASNTSRKGCTIQFITASHTGYVFFGGSAPGDTTTSFQLSPGQSLNCTVGESVLTDAIQLTSSNNSDVFVVNSY